MHNLETQKLKFFKKNHLLRDEDYKHLFSEGKHYNCSCFRVLVRFNEVSYPKLGLRISKKYLKHAVDRNRIKRIVRESFRLNQDRLKGLDVVVIAKREISDSDNTQIKQCLERLWGDL